MANRYFKQFPLVKSPRTIILCGEISLSAAGAVLSSTVDFASVSKTATGEYTILLQDKYVQTKAIHISHEGTTGDRAKVKADTQASDKKIILNTYVANVVADVAVACKLHVMLMFKDSTTTN